MFSAVVVCTLVLLALCNANIIIYTTKSPHSIAQEFRDLPASFGGELPLDGLRGFLAVGQPEDGCAALAPPPTGPTTDNFTGKWIVLLARFVPGRYNCSFEVKVRNAQQAGYDCVIVHNVNSSDLETMSAKDPEGILIPSVFVSDVAGEMLAQEFVYSEGFYLIVNGDLPFNINTHLLLPFAIVVALCLIVMIIFMIVKCIKDRRRARRHRLPRRSLQKIPTCKFSKGDPYDTCAICLDDYQDGDKLRVLPCAHAYHAACIDPWLTQNRRVCPVCKRRVFAADERRRARGADSDSDSDDSREPLVAPAPARPARATQGGTFVEQRENPFVRATRFMSRLRARAAPAPPADHAQEEETSDVEYEAVRGERIGSEDERRPLVSRAFGEAERAGRRRSRRARARRAAAEPRPRARSSGDARARPALSINRPPAAPAAPAAAFVPALPAPPAPRDERA